MSREAAKLFKKKYQRHGLKDVSSILFLRTDHWFNIKSGGSVGHISGVINGLRSLGYQIHIVSTDYLVGVEEDDFFYLCRPAYNRGRNIPNIPELLYNDQLIRYIDERRKELNPGYIYQRYSLGNYAGVVLKLKYGIPYICEYNGSFSWMARNWNGRKLFHERLMTRIELLNLHAADLVVVVSKIMKDELIKRGVLEDKILVNPNGVDTDKYSPDIDGSSICQKYNLKNKIVIGFIGTFGQWHGAEVLAKAFGKMIQKFPDYRKRLRLLMVGDGITMPQVKENLNTYGVMNESILAGRIPQEEGPVHLAACDILVASHVSNPDSTPFFGSPTKLFEYMAMGKGIVASNLDQIGEVLKHEKTAFLVKPGDVEDLMKGLYALVENEHLRLKLAKNAREVVEKYTWKEHVKKIVSGIEKVLNF
jgi:glycosyltransferase involved in cell wall biosynthesis